MNRSIYIIAAVIGLCLVLTSCKPRTRTTDQEKHLKQAMIFIRMNDSTQRAAYAAMPDERRKAIDSILSSYKNATETVVTEESYIGFNVTVTVESSFENGKFLHQKAKYADGTRAFEYYPVKNGDVIDSTLHYYSTGNLYSRLITYADPSKWMFENYHENGALRSRQTGNITKGWDEYGTLVSETSFANNEVVKQTLFHPNGTKKWESHWKNDKFHGTVKEWDSLGTLVRNELYKNGAVIK